MHRLVLPIALAIYAAAPGVAAPGTVVGATNENSQGRRPDQAAQQPVHRRPTYHAAPFRRATRANADSLQTTPATYRPNNHRLTLETRQKSLAEQESELLSDIADGRLNSRSLMETALILGRVQDTSDMRRSQGRWQAFRTLSKQYVSANGSDALKAAQLYQFMHEHILTGKYIEECNAVDRALLNGDYNCVTASILFCCLARDYDVRVEPESLPGHVRCRVFDSQATSNSFHVETTDPNWSAATALHEESGENESIASRLLTDVEVLAKLFYNRGLDYLAGGDFAAALEATELSWQLDNQHEAARDNVATVINNWALELSTQSKYEEALSLLERGQQLVPDHPILYANQTHIRAAWERDSAANN